MPHVLVIENAYLFAEYLKDIATLAGARSVAIATTQSAAIAAANERLPSLIMSDVHLDEGSGPAAVETIMANHGVMSVIFITGNSLEQSSCPRGSIVLNKPVTPNAILAAINAIDFQRGSAKPPLPPSR
jgi:CheY-like chemotaxis protein